MAQSGMEGCVGGGVGARSVQFSCGFQGIWSEGGSSATWTPAKLSRKLQPWGVVDRAYYESSTLEKKHLVEFSSAQAFSYSEGKMAEDEGSQDTLRLQFRAMQRMQRKGYRSRWRSGRKKNWPPKRRWQKEPWRSLMASASSKLGAELKNQLWAEVNASLDSQEALQGGRKMGRMTADS